MMSIRNIGTTSGSASTSSRFGTSKGLIKILFCVATIHGIICTISSKGPSQNVYSAYSSSLFTSDLSLFRTFFPSVQAFTPNKVMIHTRMPTISRSLVSSRHSMASTATVQAITDNFMSCTSKEQSNLLTHRQRWTTFYKKSHRSKSSCIYMSTFENYEEDPVSLTKGENEHNTLNFELQNSSNKVTDDNVSLSNTASGSSSLMSSQQSEFLTSNLGEFDPSKKIPIKREVLVGDPQIKIRKKEKSVTAILQELAAIQQQGPRKYCILGTRHCSYLHQQIIELL